VVLSIWESGERGGRGSQLPNSLQNCFWVGQVVGQKAEATGWTEHGHVLWWFCSGAHGDILCVR
jgi:hypothetical protein